MAQKGGHSRNRRYLCNFIITIELLPWALTDICLLCYGGGMWKTSTEKRVQVLMMLVEGLSIRAISRVAGVAFNTVTALMSKAADAAGAFHGQHTRGIRGRRHIQCDELWSFLHCKDARVRTAKAPPPHAGNVWTFTGIDTDSKLIVSYLVGQRDGPTAQAFMFDLSGRLKERPQISTDGLYAYREAVDAAFTGNVDFAQIIKSYSSDQDDRRYSPASCTSMEKIVVYGSPDLDTANTSYVERHNLTMRMSMRRLTRLTNGFSKRLEKHRASLEVYFYWYNWCRPNSAVRTKLNNQVTPAMAAGLADRPRTLEQLVELVDERAPKPRRPATYRKKISV